MSDEKKPRVPAAHSPTPLSTPSLRTPIEADAHPPELQSALERGDQLMQRLSERAPAEQLVKEFEARDPRPDDERGPSTQRPMLDAHTPRTEHVLVADDETDIRETLALILVDEGYNVRTAGDGAEALVKALRTTVQPDLILLDVGMPYVTGVEFQAALAAVMRERQLPDIPILWITAGDPDRLPDHIRRDFVFTKPLKLELLLASARARINEGRLVRLRKATP